MLGQWKERGGCKARRNGVRAEKRKRGWSGGLDAKYGFGVMSTRSC